MAPSIFLGDSVDMSTYTLNNLLKNDSNDPVLGLNLKDYFSKMHLADQPPMEPIPPGENPLEMT